MPNILNCGLLNLLNTVSQIIIAISAIVAIIITIKQIKHIRKANLKGYYKCALGMIKHETSNKLEVVAGINVEIINVGLAPVYIEYCGLEFIDKLTGKDKPGLMTNFNVVCINPGENYHGTIPIIDTLLNKIDDKVSLHDKVYVYVKLCNGKMYRWKTKDDYAAFKHECVKMIKRAEESSKYIEKKTLE